MGRWPMLARSIKSCIEVFSLSPKSPRPFVMHTAVSLPFYRQGTMSLHSSPLSIRGAVESSTKAAYISSALSIVIFSIVVFLFAFSFRLLLRVPLCGFKRMRRFLLGFITLMLFLSTLALASILTLNISNPPNLLSLYSHNLGYSFTSWWYIVRKLENCCATATIWAADWFMIWRCVVLYQGALRTLRRVVLAFCALMFLLSFGIGLVFTIPLGKAAFFLVLFSSTTLFINVAITSLIVWRLLYHQHVLRQSFGSEYRSPYSKVVALFIESASLVVAFNIVLVVFALVRSGNDPYSLVLVQITVQIYATSPLLIIAKVAYDRVYQRNPSCSTRDIQAVVDRDVEATSPRDQQCSENSIKEKN